MLTTFNIRIYFLSFSRPHKVPRTKRVPLSAHRFVDCDFNFAAWTFGYISVAVADENGDYICVNASGKNPCSDDVGGDIKVAAVADPCGNVIGIIQTRTSGSR